VAQDTWIAFVSGLSGALIGAMSSLGGTALSGRQRRQERDETARRNKEERDAAQRKAVDDRNRETADHYLVARVSATAGALWLAADISNRPAPRAQHTSSAETDSLRARWVEVTHQLVVMSVSDPNSSVALAANDTLLKLAASIGSLVKQSDAAHAAGVAAEDANAEAALNGAVGLLAAVRAATPKAEVVPIPPETASS
jgi:hypothetical protein